MAEVQEKTTKRGRPSLNLTNEEYKERAVLASRRHCEKVGREAIASRQKNYYQQNEEYRMKKILKMREYRARKKATKNPGQESS